MQTRHPKSDKWLVLQGWQTAFRFGRVPHLRWHMEGPALGITAQSPGGPQGNSGAKQCTYNGFVLNAMAIDALACEIPPNKL